MSFLKPFLEVTEATPDRMAIWAPGHEPVSFIELRRLAASAQALCRENGVLPGDTVLMVDRPGPLLYASLIGTIATGACPLLVEPWISIRHIEAILEEMKPKAFFSSTLGKVLSLRIPAIRTIPHTIHPRTLLQHVRGSALELAPVRDDTPALVTFTSSVDQPARAIVRSHGALARQLDALSLALESRFSDAPQLCLFTNTVLAQLLSGRSSLLMPQRWTSRAIRWLQNLPPALSPVAVHCSPGFLASVMELGPLPSLRKIHLSRAIADCAFLEKAFAHWPDAEFKCLYGSSEFEPLAWIDAREAVKLSRGRGYIQTVALGAPIAHLSGGASSGVPGDRLEMSGGIWWYKGRVATKVQDFELEQKIYHFLGSTDCFLCRDAQDGLHLVGENLKAAEDKLKQEFPELQTAVDTPLVRDKRHRSWINRRKTLQQGASWLLEGVTPS